MLFGSIFELWPTMWQHAMLATRCRHWHFCLKDVHTHLYNTYRCIHALYVCFLIKFKLIVGVLWLTKTQNKLWRCNGFWRRLLLNWEMRNKFEMKWKRSKNICMQENRKAKKVTRLLGKIAGGCHSSVVPSGMGKGYSFL